MAAIVVCGGSLIGLSAAMLLARDGHEVTVLERDPAPTPTPAARAWTDWERNGVAQFHQPHNLFPRFRRVLDEEMPEMVGRLVDAGCVWLDPLDSMPPFIEDREPRPGDDRFRFVTGRRPVIESVFATAADENAGVAVRRGVGVAGLLTGPAVIDGVPHVSGVRTAEGEEIRADLVVDAMGRRSKLVDWLAPLRGRPPQVESEDCGFVYYTQYFSGPRLPQVIGPVLSPMGTFSLLTLPGDNGTWSVTIWAASADTALRGLRDAGRFASVVRACPLHAHWLEGEPITSVLAMAGILDRYRRFVADGQPVVTGVAAVGDAWACTNPSAGRGLTVGLVHAQRLRDVVRTELADPGAFAFTWDAVTEEAVAPFYWNQIAADRARIAEMDALRQGLEPPPPDPMTAAFATAMVHDADVFRGFLETLMCLAFPPEVLARPGFADKIDAVADKPGLPLPAPTRAELLTLLS
jgi:2-polyprenyl-6-methoxyphenol hydroxylase-like FAD-dependent oxidoreductase